MLVIVAPVPSSRLVALLAGAWAALAAWVSWGAIAFSGPPSTAGAEGASRIGVLSLEASHLVLAAIAGVVVAAIGWNGRGRAAAVAVSPLLIVFLPWLPIPVPAAFLAWTGAFASLVWIAVAIALASVVSQGRSFHGPGTPRRHAAAAGLAACGIFAAAAWFASPSLLGGDEPHYLVITQSLLYDHDLKIENNHRRADYSAYFFGDLQPHSIRPGRNGAIYSIHAPGLPALVAPAFALSGYHGVVVFLILLSASGCALAWWLAWRASGDLGAAWFGWAAVVVSAPFLLESFTVFPDGPGAIVVLTGFWALLRAEWERSAVDGADGSAGRTSPMPWFLHGLALALLPWLHTRFSVLAATLGGLVLVRLARTPNALAKAIAFLVPPAISATGWMFFFAVIYGTPDPSAPYGPEPQNFLAFLPDGLGGLLFDQGFGAIATAPVLGLALLGFARARRLALDWLVVALPYVLAVATYAMWWAGLTGPARFLVPLLLPLAIPAAIAWTSARSRGARAVLASALIVSAWMAALMAGGGGGRLGYHTRNEGGPTVAPWLEWANPVVALPAAFPAFVPQPVPRDPGGLVSRARAAREGFVTALTWIVCLGAAAALVAWGIDRRRDSPPATIAGAAFVFAAAAMLAMSIAWRLHDAQPLTAAPAQLDVLRRLASGPAVTVDLSSYRRLPPDDAWSMRIEVPVVRGVRPAAGVNRPLGVFPAVPAGSYVISVRRQGGDGWVMVGVGNDQFAIVTEPVAAFDTGVRVDVPIAVRALIVRGDEGARDQVQAIQLRPVARPPARLGTETARRAVRYDAGVVYFLDDRAYPEPGGFWVAGARETRVVVQPLGNGRAVLLVRGGPAETVVTLESGQWREAIALRAGEERRIDLPIDASRRAALVRIGSSAGFRPSEADPASRDRRFLGVYVRPAEP